MLEKDYISQNEYDTAVSEIDNGLTFKKGKITNTSTIYSYHTDALFNEVVTDLMDSKNISKSFATNYFYLSGSKIYGTSNENIQKILQTEGENSKYILTSNNGTDTSQAAMVVLDNDTGYVLGCIGGLGKKNESRTFNRATQMKRQTGSAMKPVAVLLPAISERLITNVSVYADEPTSFFYYNGNPYSPIIYDN